MDSFGAAVLIKKFSENFHVISLGHGTPTIAYRLDSVDPKRLLLFLISILWRASVSTQLFYHGVRLGPFESEALDAISLGAEEVNPAFDAVLSYWDASVALTSLTDVVVSPARERWDNVNAYRLYLGKIIAYVKVDPREFPEPLSDLSLRNAGTVWAIARELDGSNDYKAMVQTAASSQRGLVEPCADATVSGATGNRTCRATSA